MPKATFDTTPHLQKFLLYLTNEAGVASSTASAYKHNLVLAIYTALHEMRFDPADGPKVMAVIQAMPISASKLALTGFRHFNRYLISLGKRPYELPTGAKQAAKQAEEAVPEFTRAVIASLLKYQHMAGNPTPKIIAESTWRIARRHQGYIHLKWPSMDSFFNEGKLAKAMEEHIAWALRGVPPAMVQGRPLFPTTPGGTVSHTAVAIKRIAVSSQDELAKLEMSVSDLKVAEELLAGPPKDQLPSSKTSSSSSAPSSTGPRDNSRFVVVPPTMEEAAALTLAEPSFDDFTEKLEREAAERAKRLAEEEGSSSASAPSS